MPEPAVFRRVRQAFVPANESGDKLLASVNDGVSLVLAKKQVRSPQQLALYWAVIGKVHSNLNDIQTTQWPTTDKFSDAIKVACGFYEVGHAVDGTPFPKPRSIARANMSQRDFNEFLDKAVDLICTKIIPGMNRDDLGREVNEMLGAA